MTYKEWVQLSKCPFKAHLQYCTNKCISSFWETVPPVEPPQDQFNHLSFREIKHGLRSNEWKISLPFDTISIKEWLKTSLDPDPMGTSRLTRLRLE
jgi:hypothetical protein